MENMIGEYGDWYCPTSKSYISDVTTAGYCVLCGHKAIWVRADQELEEAIEEASDEKT